MAELKQGADAPILLAFSGGLDTSFCVPWLAERYARPVVTVTVNTGGIDAAAAQALEARALALGAAAHHLVDARGIYFERVLKWLLVGNVRRGQLYPLCVGAERTVQAQVVAEMARNTRHRHDRARLHGGRQRPGSLRGGAADARARHRDPRAGARRVLQAPRAARLPRKPRAAGAAAPAPPTPPTAASGASPSAGARR